MSSILGKQLAVVQVSPGEFVSEECPGAFGNAGGIAYGGGTLGVATQASYATVSDNYSLYSLVGQFLGPASSKSKLYCTVEKVWASFRLADYKLPFHRTIQNVALGES